QTVVLLVSAFSSDRDLYAQTVEVDSPWDTIAPHFQVPEKYQGDTGGYGSVLQFHDGSPVKSVEDWQRRRKELLSDWTKFLGKWPDLISDPKVEVLETVRRENIVQLKVRFLWTPKEQTTGYLLLPEGQGKHPAIVTVFYEPETAIGLNKEHRDFAIQLARRGFVALSIGTTEASKASTYAIYHPDIDNAAVQPL
ncbi:MAG: sialidase, partial [Fuerstiella sp.]|nr:sialidase [Fuerstiella sp.]